MKIVSQTNFNTCPELKSVLLEEQETALHFKNKTRILRILSNGRICTRLQPRAVFSPLQIKTIMNRKV